MSLPILIRDIDENAEKKNISKAEVQTPAFSDNYFSDVSYLLISSYASLLVYCAVFWIILWGNIKSFTLQESK